MSKTIFISGITGSWGHELTKHLLKDKKVKKIIGISRGELAQVEMSRKFNNKKVSLHVCDVRDYERVNELMKDVDTVYHLAALKHVPVCEDNSDECIKTNIVGVQNIIKASINNGVKLVVDVSTDKACNPFNIYGASKSVGEKLIINSNNKNVKTKFVCVRAGNVIGSNGSVIPFFINRAKNKQPLPITDYNMTRYMMTLPDAIGLVLKASKKCYGGEIFVTKMPATYITLLAEVIYKFYNGEIPIKKLNDIFPEIGIRSGEKIDEMLISEHEALYTVEDKNFRIVLPMNGSLDKKYKKYKKMVEKEYTSNDKLMNKLEVKKMLIKSEVLE